MKYVILLHTTNGMVLTVTIMVVEERSNSGSRFSFLEVTLLGILRAAGVVVQVRDCAGTRL